MAEETSGRVGPDLYLDGSGTGQLDVLPVGLQAAVTPHPDLQRAWGVFREADRQHRADGGFPRSRVEAFQGEAIRRSERTEDAEGPAARQRLRDLGRGVSRVLGQGT